MVHGKVYRVALMASCFDISQKLIHFTSGESPDIPKSHGSMIAVTDPLSINLKAISTSCQMSCDGVMCVSSWLATPSSISHGSANGEYAAMSCRFQRPRQFLSYQIISGLMLCEIHDAAQDLDVELYSMVMEMEIAELWREPVRWRIAALQ